MNTNTHAKLHALTKQLLSLFIIFSLAFSTYSSVEAASGDLVYAKGFGNTGNDIAYAVTTDTSGNVYTTGQFQGTVDFDPGVGTTNLTADGGHDAFITKFDSSGNLVWAKSIRGTGTEIGYGIGVDTNGNVYTTGTVLGTADFNPGAGTFNITPPGGQDVYISKLDPNGDFVWAKVVGAASAAERSFGLVVDSGNNVYINGYFQDTTDFDPGAGTVSVASMGTYDVFVLKLDSAGDYVWVKTLGGTSEEWPSGIAIDGSNNIYTTGYTVGTADLDPSAGTSTISALSSSRNVFISKLDSSGNFVWGKGFLSSSYLESHAISADSFGNVYTTGYFSGATDFDPGVGTYSLTPTGSRSTFISKLNSSGDFVWTKSFESINSITGRSIGVDSEQNVFTGGYFASSTDFDPGLSSFTLDTTSINDMFVSKLNSSGNFVWAKAIGGNGSDLAYGIDVDSSDYLHIAGYFSGTADFDTGAGTTSLTAGGTADAFIMKIENDLIDPVVSASASPGVTDDSTPDFTFSSTEAGTATYGGSCSSVTTAITSGSNTVTFNSLTPGTYTNCTILITDASGNISNTITVPSFTVTASTAVAAGTSSGGGGVYYGCKDEKALNYEFFAASNPALCKYSTGSVGTMNVGGATVSASVGVGAGVGASANTSAQSVSSNSNTSTTTSKTVFTRDLQVGSVGDDVQSLQNILISQNAGPSAKALMKNGATKRFGPLTKSALREYQKAKGITPATGNFGPKTRTHFKSVGLGE